VCDLNLWISNNFAATIGEEPGKALKGKDLAILPPPKLSLVKSIDNAHRVDHMADDKQALESAKFIKVESAFNDGSIEKDTAELQLGTYRQIQSCFLGLCLFCGLGVLAMQHTETHMQLTLARQTLLRSAEDSTSSNEIEANAIRDARRLTAYQDLLAESERKFGSDSTLLIPAISQLAALNTQLDRLPEAERLYERSQMLIQKYKQEQENTKRHSIGNIETTKTLKGN
jgi:hypothetical protein